MNAYYHYLTAQVVTELGYQLEHPFYIFMFSAREKKIKADDAIQHEAVSQQLAF